MGRSREELIQQDVKDLHGLGYAQELYRSMGGFSNFAISFSIISILTGGVILYDYGLAWAGKAAVSIGWPLITIFVLCIAAAMAEIASAYPTAGGLYYWASKMKNKNWGWWTAWLNLLGQFAIVAGINYAAAGFINATIIDKITGGPAFNTTELIPNVLNGQLVTMGILMLVELAMNIAGINLVALLNQVSVWWHIVVVALVVLFVMLIGKPDESGLSLFAVAPLDTAGTWENNLGFTTFAYGPASTYPVILAFFFSLLQANWTYTGYDASAHVAEETVGARVSSAWGVFLSVAVSAVVGYVFLMALTLHTPSMATLFPPSLDDAATYSQYYFGGGVAVITILQYNLGQLGDVFAAGIAIAMAFCGLSSVAAAGRMLFAFARDDGLPGAGWLKKVSRRYRTPANSLAGIVVIAWLFNVLAFTIGAAGGPGGGGIAIVIVTAVSTIFLYAAYGIVIYLGATTSEWHQHRVWSLGRWSKPIAWVAVIWCVILMGLFSFPTSGNISWPFMVIAILLLLVYYYTWAKARFQGPRIMGAEQQLTDIEREFEAAAEDLRKA